MDLYQRKTDKFPAIQYVEGSETDIISGLRDLGFAAMYREAMVVDGEVTVPEAIVIQEFNGEYTNTYAALKNQWIAVDSSKSIYVWDDDKFNKVFEAVTDA